MMIADSSDITVGEDGEKVVNHYKMIAYTLMPNGERWPLESNLMPISHRPESGTVTTYHLSFSVPKNGEGESKI